MSPLHLPTLTIACALVLALSAGALALFGLSSRTYRGYWWWVGAQAMLASGLALSPQRDALPWLLPLINGLCLQWPVTVLAGLRRFYGRQEWQVPARVDVLLLALAFAACVAAWLGGSGVQGRVIAFATGSALLCAYATWLVTRLREFGQTSTLKAFATMTLLMAAYQAWRAIAAGNQPAGQPLPDALLLAGSVMLSVTALAMLYMALLLTAERTEANLLVTQRKLRVLADMDVLTGMANRRHFLERADDLLDAPDAPPSAVLMFDIDHFKQINDLLGHAVGDEALRQIARCVRDTLREHDVAGRLGGDEFAVLLPDTSVGDAMAVASRIVARLEHRQVAPRVARLSLSFGIVQTNGSETILDALRRADQALYEAKRQGRNRAVAATGDADQPVFGESRPMGLSAY